MKKLFITIIIILAVNSAKAQVPKLSYILPDLGAPGMNTYVEFIADANAVGTFGTDNDVNNEVYLNNPGDRIRVKCTNPLDTNRVIIGPIIVSSQGRVIATQIYIHPKLKAPNLYPNSWDWRLLRKEFRIPIHVEVNGIASTPDTFYIVRPFEIDPSKTSERVLGQGALGIRSPRGAMLFGYDDQLKDSYNVFLGSGTYTVSRNDTDPYRDGNQGYLPFTLLVKGILQGAVGGTTISVDALGKDGGVGGGGGGGSFCDASPLNFGIIGQSGGDGFTGGGPGGRNRSGIPFASDAFTNRSIGSGNSLGVSLNNVQSGATPAYECAGGGTGHPLGQSGGGWTGSGNPIGGYGAGSGESQKQRGGGGGFATVGEGINQSFGNIVGNKCLVPAAGGSGGASGNPQGIGDCSGVGGGGGGAIKVFAYQISEVNFFAQGADGSNEQPEGGSGSGGSVTMQAKTALNNVNTSVIGGGLGNNDIPNGGEGRIRYDAETISQVPTGTSVFRGLRTDRIDVVPRTFLYKGISGNTYTRVFFKPEGKPWREYNDMPAGSPDTWTVTIDLKDKNVYPERIFFLVATQIIPNNVTGGYTAEPVRIMSQAAADIAQLREAPIAIADDSVRLDSVLCPGDNKPKQGRIWNEGGEELRLNKISFRKDNQGFSYSIDKTRIAPNDTGRFTFTWQVPVNSKLLDFEDELMIETNDPDPTRSIVFIKVFIHRDTVDVGIVDKTTDLNELQTIDFGTLCINNPQKRIIYYRNKSSIPINPSLITIEDISNYSINYTVPQPFSSGMSMPIEITYRAKSKGSTSTRLIIRTPECNSEDILQINAKGIETQLEFTGTGQFNDVRVGENAQMTVILKNTGSADASLPPSFFVMNPPFRIVSTNPNLPTVLSPQAEMVITIEYMPTIEAKDTAVLGIASILSSNSCIDTATMLIAGKSYRSNITTSKSSIDYGVLNRCTEINDTLLLYNKGGNDVKLDSIAIITGAHPNSFLITEQPAIPSIVKAGDSVRYIIRFDRQNAINGLNTGILIIYTDDKDFSIISRPLSAIRRELQIGIPAFVTLPQTVIGVNASGQVDITNGENSPIVIQSIIPKNTATVQPNQLTIPIGGNSQFTCTLPITKSGINRDTLLVYISQPCADTQTVIIECIGIIADVKQNNRLDFGRTEFCETSLDSVIITNTGQADITINSMDISGTDKQFFRFVNSMVFPATLTPQSRIIRQVEFFPTITTDGAKTATVTTVATVGGKQVELSTELYGERTSTLLAAPTISVLKVEEQSLIEDRLTLKNIGSRTIRIDNVLWRDNYPDLSIVAEQPYSLPADIAPNGEISFRVIFAPTAVVSRNDMLIFNISNPCVEERQIPVRAQSIPTTRTYIYLPNDSVLNPRTIDYSIPITMRMTPVDAVLENVGFRAEILIDERIFYPKRATVGSLTVTKEPNTRKNKIVVQGDGITRSNTNSLITEIIGDALLGSIEQDSIVWGVNGFRWTRGTSARVDSVRDGFLRLILCEEGGKRLLYDSILSVTSFTVAPNPIISENVILKINSAEIGEYAVYVTSLSGEKLYERNWEQTEVQTEGSDINLPTKEWLNGIYFITLKMPSGYTQQRITILR